MILGEGNDGASCGSEKVNDNVSADEASGKLSVGQAFGFYPSMLGMTEVKDNYVSVGVFPPEDEQGSKGRVKKEGDEGVEGEANEMEIDGNAEKTIISSSSSSSSGGGGGGGVGRSLWEYSVVWKGFVVHSLTSSSHKWKNSNPSC